jgi:vancomycin resistance protein VanJ
MSIQTLSRAAITSGTTLFLIGLVLRVTVRDQWDGWSVFFYATPWPVLAVLAILIGVAHGLRRRKRLAASFVAAGLICAGAWYGQSVVRNPMTETPHQCRVVSWNAEHSKRQLPEVIETVRAFHGDIIGITETESTHPADAERWKAAFPHQTVKTLPGFMLFITRAEILSSVHGDLAGAGRYNAVKLRLDGRDITVLFVEFDANPLRSRRPAFTALEELRRRHTGEELILMGDFNTPRDSHYFDDLRSGMAHAFEAAGNGIADTWPLPFPVLSLDHVWTTPGLKAVRCELGWSHLSDHRPVVVDLAF